MNQQKHSTMKKVKSFLLAAALFFLTGVINAQIASEVIPVSGNCGMCKGNIEKAAKKAGATEADWNKETKMLSVKYDQKATSATKIQQSIADVGYDTRDIRGVDEAYKNLHSCCKYDRTMTYDAKTTKNKGGDDMACCEKSDKQCCKDKMAAKKAGQKVECKKDSNGKSCCEKK